MLTLEQGSLRGLVQLLVYIRRRANEYLHHCISGVVVDIMAADDRDGGEAVPHRLRYAIEVVTGMYVPISKEEICARPQLYNVIGWQHVLW